jgi:hypothetical protein
LIRRLPLDPMRSSPYETQACELAGRFDRWHSSTYGASATTVTA